MTTGVFHLEKFHPFLERLVDLNRVYAPDDELLDAMLASDDAEASEARKHLVAIHKNFPSGEPLHHQAAYLIRAFNGLRPFGEANHRTAWDYLDDMVRHDDHRLLASEDEGRALGNEVWVRLQGEYPDGFVHEHVEIVDATYAYLLEWFRHRIA